MRTIWLVWEIKEEFCDQCGRRERRRLAAIEEDEQIARDSGARFPACRIEKFDPWKGEPWQINT
jgi:hypothetical protein